jgi:hypothetical protein
MDGGTMGEMVVLMVQIEWFGVKMGAFRAVKNDC